MDCNTFAELGQNVKKEAMSGSGISPVHEASSVSGHSECPNNSMKDKFHPLKIKQEIGSDFMSDSDLGHSTNDDNTSDHSPNFSDDLDDQGDTEPETLDAKPADVGFNHFDHFEQDTKKNSTEQAIPLGLFLNRAHFFNESQQGSQSDSDIGDKNESHMGNTNPGMTIGDGGRSDVQEADSVSKSHPSISALLSRHGKEATKSPNGVQTTEVHSSHVSSVSSSLKGHQSHPKPFVSTSTLIALALKNSRMGRLSCPEIYEFISKTFPYYQSATDGWKSVVRCRLSTNKLFIKVDESVNKGNLWSLNPAYLGQMDGEFSRWTTRPPKGILESLAHPTKLLSLVKGQASAPPMKAPSHTVKSQLLKSKLTATKLNTSPVATAMQARLSNPTTSSLDLIMTQLLKNKLASAKRGNSSTTMTQHQFRSVHSAQSHLKIPGGSSVLQKSTAARSKSGYSSAQVRQFHSPASQRNRLPNSHAAINKAQAYKQLLMKVSGSGSVLQDGGMPHKSQIHPRVKQHMASSSTHTRPSAGKASGSATAAVRQGIHPAMQKNVGKNKLVVENNLDGMKTQVKVGKQTLKKVPIRRRKTEDNEDESQRKKKRRVWVDPTKVNRHTDGVMVTVYPQLIDDDEKFYHFVMMSRDSFETLLEKMGDQIYRMDTNWRKAIPPRERLLLTLRYLVTGESSRTLSTQFQIGISTIREIIYGACDAICNCLKDSELPRLTAQAFKSISSKFYQKWKYPHCIGALGWKHINLQIPGPASESGESHKGKIPILLQGVVDADGNFIAVDVIDLSSDLSGSVLKWSAFGDALCKDQLPIPKADTFLEKSDDELEQPLPYVFIGSVQQPLLKNLMRTYPPRGMNETRRIYNERHDKARGIVDRVFDSMVAKWSIMRSTINMNLLHAYKVVLVCCVLHNYIMNREGGGTELVEEEQTLTMTRQRKKCRGNLTQTAGGRPSQDAMITRDKFAKVIASDLHVPPVVVPEPSNTSVASQNSSKNENTSNPSTPSQHFSDNGNPSNSLSENTPVDKDSLNCSVSAQNSSDIEDSSNHSVTVKNSSDDGNTSGPSVPIQNSSDDGNTSGPSVPTQNSSDDGNTSGPSVPTQNSSDDGNTSGPSVPIQNSSDDGNTSDPSVPIQNSSDDGNTSGPSVPTQNSSDDGNTSGPSVPTQNSSDDGNTSGPSVPTQNSSDDRNTSDPSVPTQNSSNDGNTSDPSVPTQNSSDDGNTSDPVPTQNSSDDGNTSGPSVPTQNSSDDGNTSGPSVPTQNSSDDGNTSDPSVPTQNSSDDGNTSDPSVPTQNSSDDGNTSGPSVPTQNSSDDGNTSGPSVPTQNSSDSASILTHNHLFDAKTSHFSFPSQSSSDDENTSNISVDVQKS